MKLPEYYQKLPQNASGRGVTAPEQVPSLQRHEFRLSDTLTEKRALTNSSRLVYGRFLIDKKRKLGILSHNKWEYPFFGHEFLRKRLSK
jgi:hypothetical protein